MEDRIKGLLLTTFDLYHKTNSYIEYNNFYFSNLLKPWYVRGGVDFNHNKIIPYGITRPDFVKMKLETDYKIKKSVKNNKKGKGFSSCSEYKFPELDSIYSKQLIYDNILTVLIKQQSECSVIPLYDEDFNRKYEPMLQRIIAMITIKLDASRLPIGTGEMRRLPIRRGIRIILPEVEDLKRSLEEWRRF